MDPACAGPPLLRASVVNHFGGLRFANPPYVGAPASSAEPLRPPR
jgi:hypothetical protein